MLRANGCKGVKGNIALNINKFVLGLWPEKIEIDLYYSFVKADILKE
jgi:hypothetical protein